MSFFFNFLILINVLINFLVASLCAGKRLSENMFDFGVSLFNKRNHVYLRVSTMSVLLNKNGTERFYTNGTLNPVS